MTATPSKKQKPWIRLKGLSIQQRLPLLICVLLLSIIVTYTWISHLGIRKVSVNGAAERLHSLTGQLATMFGQSTQNYIKATSSLAKSDSIKNFLLSGGSQFRDEAAEAMNRFRRDSSTVLIELLDENNTQLLQAGKPGMNVKADMATIIKELALIPDSSKIGKMVLSGDSIYYPVVASVTVNKQIAGYLVRWRLVHASPKSIEQFTKLIGSDASLYFGNTDGSLWSDMSRPVQGIIADKRTLSDLLEFSPGDSNKVIAATQPIPNSPWTVLVGFPRETILAPANQFLRSSLLIGGLLLIAGMSIAWFMSRGITRPLNKLTAAASAISHENYSVNVEVNRRDELGKLANAFNIMTGHVHMARLDLEKKVQERTLQLQNANNELEAFSYSVSHDLRAPLRAISGYSLMLKEDYAKHLDEEANRITDRIIRNAKMMGQLIDDLISFSQMGVKEIDPQTIDMTRLAESCLDELLQNGNSSKYSVQIDDLPSCEGDLNLMKQVWLNLISNAIKYSSKEAQPRIEIGFKEDTRQYFIRDSGVGFDMQHAHKLFGVFQRLHSHKDFDGTGIGLAFVKRILSKHKGQISAESRPGEGATFYFSLPSIKIKMHSLKSVSLSYDE